MTGRAELLAFGPEGSALLAALHAESFADPDVTGPAWDAKSFADLLSLPGCFALVARTPDGGGPGDGTRPLGLVLARVAADEAEILTLGVPPGARRGGIGRILVQAAAERAGAVGAAKLFLEVAATNAPARALYAALGFAEVGRRRGYYRLGGRAVDALILSRGIAGHPV